MAAYLLSSPPCPAQIRRALVSHLARKLGRDDDDMGRLLVGLSNDDIAASLRVGADETWCALQARAALRDGITAAAA